MRGFPIVDPDGNVTEADGDTYGPSLCDGFDAATWFEPNPTCAMDGAFLDHDACAAWGRASYPQGRGAGFCTPTPTDAGLVGICARGFGWIPPSCEETPEGNAYCRALVQPFVPSSVPAYSCVRRYMGGPPATWTECGWDTRCGCLDGRICVMANDGGVTCVPPCE